MQLPDLQPAQRAIAVDLIRKAKPNGFINHSQDLPDDQRRVVSILSDELVLERVDEHTLRLLISKAAVIQAYASQNGAPVPAVPLSATSYKPTDKGGCVSQRRSRMLTDNPWDCQGSSEDSFEDEKKPSKLRPAEELETLPVDRWNTRHLTAYYAREISEAAVLARIALGPRPFNWDALRGHFARWRRDDGLTNEQIKVMIDLFAKRITNYHRQGKPVWQTFLGLRQRLFVDAQRRAKESKTYTADEWLEDEPQLVAAGHHDENYWIGD